MGGIFMSTKEIQNPGGEIAKKNLNLFFIIDKSGSMSGKKNEAVTQAMKEIKTMLINAGTAHPDVNILIRVIAFSDNAVWIVGPTPVSPENFNWISLSPGGFTSTIKAFDLTTSVLISIKEHCLSSGLIFLSDGFTTDSKIEYEKKIQELIDTPLGKRSIRHAIAIGDESNYDENELLKFVSHKEVGVLKAKEIGQIIDHLKWATSGVVQCATDSSNPQNDSNLYTVVHNPEDRPKLNNINNADVTWTC